MLDIHKITTISDNYLNYKLELHEDELYRGCTLSFAPIIKKIIIDNSFTSVSVMVLGKKT